MFIFKRLIFPLMFSLFNFIRDRTVKNSKDVNFQTESLHGYYYPFVLWVVATAEAWLGELPRVETH